MANTLGFQSNVLCQVLELPEAGSSNRQWKSCLPPARICHLLIRQEISPLLHCDIRGVVDSTYQGLPCTQTPADAIQKRGDFIRIFICSFKVMALCHKTDPKNSSPSPDPSLTWLSETQWACLPSHLSRQPPLHLLPPGSSVGGSHCCLPDWCWMKWSWNWALSLAPGTTGPLSGSRSHLVGDKVQVECSGHVLNEVGRCASGSVQLFKFFEKKKKNTWFLAMAMIKQDWNSFFAYRIVALPCRPVWFGNRWCSAIFYFGVFFSSPFLPQDTTFYLSDW